MTQAASSLQRSRLLPRLPCSPPLQPAPTVGLCLQDQLRPLAGEPTRGRFKLKLPTPTPLTPAAERPGVRGQAHSGSDLGSSNLPSLEAPGDYSLCVHQPKSLNSKVLWALNPAPNRACWSPTLSLPGPRAIVGPSRLSLQ